VIDVQSKIPVVQSTTLAWPFQVFQPLPSALSRLLYHLLILHQLFLRSSMLQGLSQSGGYAVQPFLEASSPLQSRLEIPLHAVQAPDEASQLSYYKIELLYSHTMVKRHSESFKLTLYPASEYQFFAVNFQAPLPYLELVSKVSAFVDEVPII